MVTCIVLIRYAGLVQYTEEGLRMTKDIAARVERAGTALEAVGGSVRMLSVTLGLYDAIASVELPSEEFVARIHDLVHDDSARVEVLRVVSGRELDRVLAASK
jgi:uncharacterized protein with GYD domain